MLKVEETKQTLDKIAPKDLTDEYFIGIRWKSDGQKGYVEKIKGGHYVVSTMNDSANVYETAIYDDIEECLSVCKNAEIIATLDYQEFKEWYYRTNK